MTCTEECIQAQIIINELEERVTVLEGAHSLLIDNINRIAKTAKIQAESIAIINSIIGKQNTVLDILTKGRDANGS